MMKRRMTCSSTRLGSPGCARRPFSRLQIDKSHWRHGAEKDQLITGVEARDCLMKLGKFFNESEDEECFPSVPWMRRGRPWNHMSPFVIRVAGDSIESVQSRGDASSWSLVRVHSRFPGLGRRGWGGLGEDMSFQLLLDLNLATVHWLLHILKGSGPFWRRGQQHEVGCQLILCLEPNTIPKLRSIE